MTDLAHASVVTGASSSIGRATALAFAARRGEVLEEVAAECRARGGETVVVPTDVTDAETVLALARAAEEAWGGIDVEVNNAGLGVVGALADVPLALRRRVVEVDLLGALHEAHAALPVFLRRGSGVLVNNVSMGAWTPMPFASAYTASKFGLRGLTASLRQELLAHPRIHACAVFPAAIDTPRILHGANLSGKRVGPRPPPLRPERVAEASWPSRAGRARRSPWAFRRAGRASPTGSRRCPSRPPWAP